MTVINLSVPILPDWKWSSLRDDRQRIDKWLWHARLVRTRSAAAALAASGHVRLNGARIAAPAKPVKPGDVVTIALDARVRVLKVTGFAPRRGPAEAGRALYEDLSPADPGPTEAPAGVRDSGRGRPTKQDRRAIARFTRQHDS
jgi:ribosome-associated heat shock protein Hsp15